jgi:hypothetical protein
MTVIKWFALCLAILGAWFLLFAVLANPVWLIPLFIAGCVYSGIVRPSLRGEAPRRAP